MIHKMSVQVMLLVQLMSPLNYHWLDKMEIKTCFV